jgi:hypothetical protein
MVDVTSEIAQIVEGSHLALSPEELVEDLEGADRVIVCPGGLPVGRSIRGARSIVISGNVNGSEQALSEVLCSSSLIVLGNLVRARTQSRRLIVGGSARNTLMGATHFVYLREAEPNTQVRLGPSARQLETLRGHLAGLGSGTGRQGELQKQVEAARRSLGRLLQVTGVVFNLNIGKIIKQNKNGLEIDLSVFYQAVEGKSEAEIDQALSQFFAKAMVGMLTRLNRDYISSGRGHQDRFKKVVLKLQELVLKTRAFDKLNARRGVDAAQVNSLSEEYALGVPTFEVERPIQPPFELAIHGVLLDEDTNLPSIQEYRIELEAGLRPSMNTVRFFQGQTLTDMVIVPEQSLQNVQFSVAGHQIKWDSRK